MRLIAVVPVLFSVSSLAAQTIDNPAIDMAGYLRVGAEAAVHRESRRVSEDDFIRMSNDPGTIVLDARSREKYDELHIRGALHLSFSDIAAEEVRRLIPDRNTRLLIYCTNNFLIATGHLSTFIALYSYGYRNVYELGPLLDARSTKLDLVSSEGDSR